MVKHHLVLFAAIFCNFIISTVFADEVLTKLKQAPIPTTPEDITKRDFSRMPRNKDNGNDNNKDKKNILENKSLFQGDISISYEELVSMYGEKVAKAAEKHGRISKNRESGNKLRGSTANLAASQIWNNRNQNGQIVVPYLISSSYTTYERDVILNAMNDLSRRVGVVTFVERTSEVDAISFEKTGHGCSSYIGKQGKIQTISIDTPGCLVTGKIQHEVLHALGFHHEQSRSDRNSFVTINYDNVKNGYEDNFDIAQDSVEMTIKSPYDYSSVMHYGPKFFGKTASTCAQSYPVCNLVTAISFRGIGQDGSSSNYCLDVRMGQASLYDGQPIQLYSCGALGYSNQIWSIEPWGNRGVVFKLAKHRSYCLSMEFKSEDDQNNARFALYKCGSPSPNMKQIFGIFGNSWDSMVIRWEGNNEYCMDRESPNLSAASFNGQNVQLYSCGAGNYFNQYFKFLFFNYPTGVCNQINAWCSIVSDRLTTIDARGHDIGTETISSIDVLKIQALYECSTGLRNYEGFCPLRSYQSSCNNGGFSRNSGCMAAMHRFCSAKGKGGAAISQEVGSGVFGVGCFNPTWYGDVSLGSLQSYHGGCNNIGFSQTSECMAAIHRWCSANGKGGAGVAQKVGSGVFGVACFNPSWYGDVSLGSLQSYHGGCNNIGFSQTSECVAAIHRWCSANGKGGAGVAQEVGNGVFGVACFNPSWYGDVPV